MNVSSNFSSPSMISKISSTAFVKPTKVTSTEVSVEKPAVVAKSPPHKTLNKGVLPLETCETLHQYVDQASSKEMVKNAKKLPQMSFMHASPQGSEDTPATQINSRAKSARQQVELFLDQANVGLSLRRLKVKVQGGTATPHQIKTFTTVAKMVSRAWQDTKTSIGKLPPEAREQIKQQGEASRLYHMAYEAGVEAGGLKGGNPELDIRGAMQRGDMPESKALIEKYTGFIMGKVSDGESTAADLASLKTLAHEAIAHGQQPVVEAVGIAMLELYHMYEGTDQPVTAQDCTLEAIHCGEAIGEQNIVAEASSYLRPSTLARLTVGQAMNTADLLLTHSTSVEDKERTLDFLKAGVGTELTANRRDLAQRAQNILHRHVGSPAGRRPIVTLQEPRNRYPESVTQHLKERLGDNPPPQNLDQYLQTIVNISASYGCGDYLGKLIGKNAIGDISLAEARHAVRELIPDTRSKAAKLEDPTFVFTLYLTSQNEISDRQLNHALGKPGARPNMGSFNTLSIEGGSIKGRPNFAKFTQEKIPLQPDQHRRHITAWHTIRASMEAYIGSQPQPSEADLEDLWSHCAIDGHIKAEALAHMREEENKGAYIEANHNNGGQLNSDFHDLSFQDKTKVLLFTMNSNPANLWPGDGNVNTAINTAFNTIKGTLSDTEDTDDALSGLAQTYITAGDNVGKNGRTSEQNKVLDEAKGMVGHFIEAKLATERAKAPFPGDFAGVRDAASEFILNFDVDLLGNDLEFTQQELAQRFADNTFAQAGVGINRILSGQAGNMLEHIKTMAVYQ